MPVLREDLVRGHRMESSYVGAGIIRTFRASELVAPPAEQLREALYTTYTPVNLPQLGELYPATHPGLPASNLRVTNYTLTPDGPNAVLIEVQYRPPNTGSGGTWNQPQPLPGNDSQDIKQISSSLRERLTTRDADDNSMFLGAPPSKDRSPNYLSEARVLQPIGSLLFERVESEPPAARLRSYMGKLNLGAIGPYPDRTLLFAAFDAQSEDRGVTWRTSYQFDYAPEGWLHYDTWKDEQGKAPEDATLQAWHVIPAVSFAPLGLDFSDTQTPV